MKKAKTPKFSMPDTGAMTPALSTTSASAALVRYVEHVIRHGGSITGNDLTDEGARCILSMLRAGAAHAPAIAHGGDRFNVCDDLIDKAVRAMVYADIYVRDPEFPATPPNDDDRETPSEGEAEQWYLLGLLVGVELAGGVR